MEDYHDSRDDAQHFAGSAPLSPRHVRQLKASSVDLRVARRRGVRTLYKRQDFPKEYADYQRRVPALCFPMHSPDGKTVRHQIRADNPRVVDGKVRKYDCPPGVSLVLDAHPDMRDIIQEGLDDMFITEGVKTGDSTNSRGVPTLILAGVWGWVKKGGDPLPCWDHVRLDGRRVFVAFDSDAMSKLEVQGALIALSEFLQSRGSEVWITYLPDAPDGSKQGLDDFLAAGGTVPELLMLSRPFDPDDFAEIRLGRDPELREAVEELRRRTGETRWERTGGFTRRDMMVALIKMAARSGRVEPDGVRVRTSTRALALAAGTRQATVSKNLPILEATGLLRREASKSPRKPASYVLLTPPGEGRARACQKGEREDGEGKSRKGFQGFRESVTVRDTLLRAPRLRWSKPVPATPVSERETILRLGKVAGAIIDALDRAGGALTLSELAELLQRKRPRDLRARQIARLVERGICTFDGETVALVENWEDALRREREVTQEIADYERDKAKYEREKDAYRRRHETQEEEAPRPGDTRRRRERMAEEEAFWRWFAPSAGASGETVSDLARAIDRYLDRNPRDATRSASWFGRTLWAYELYPGPPASASECRRAIEELGGERYLRDLIERVRMSDRRAAS
jgi:DNA-binding MarR family transcriptional regulator